MAHSSRCLRTGGFRAPSIALSVSSGGRGTKNRFQCLRRNSKSRQTLAKSGGPKRFEGISVRRLPQVDALTTYRSC